MMAEHIEYRRGDLVTIITGSIKGIPYNTIGVVVDAQPHWRTVVVYTANARISCFNYELRLDCRPQTQLPPLPQSKPDLKEKLLKDQQELTSLLAD